MSFRAYRAMRAGKPPIVADGFTEDQLFFLAHGQAWCGKYTEALSKLLVSVDPHSPPRFRVNGPVSVSPEFAQAFSCPAGSPMNPASRCEVW
jgi:putative endopeptidase